MSPHFPLESKVLFGLACEESETQSGEDFAKDTLWVESGVKSWTHIFCLCVLNVSLYSAICPHHTPPTLPYTPSSTQGLRQGLSLATTVGDYM